ncbi:MAG: PIN domain nuclease [Candidatus Hydrogenedentes bacterium]|nr:PIN domain nuclease [Candidatus Hydrogenedentota bacterium]
MAFKLVRVLFVLACSLMGVIWTFYIVGARGGQGTNVLTTYPWVTLGAVIGCGMSLVVLYILRFVTQELFERLAPALGAIVIAMIVGYFFGEYLVFVTKVQDAIVKTYITTTLVLLFGYMGISIGLTRASNWEALIKAVRKRHYETKSPKLIDTSVIIDGRIADIWKTGFVEGTLMIPRFVLRELQNIADSPDPLRRARGRRGLDILKSLQDSDSEGGIEVLEDDPVDIREVDGKLVRVAREFNAKIITNDLNLNKVAQIEGVDVLNINDLANSLKPAVLPDEMMHVKIVKEGKEAFQGVGYLDDGTMVVVDGGKDFVGRDVGVTVTSVLQTTAGRMIFAKLSNNNYP